MFFRGSFSLLSIYQEKERVFLQNLFFLSILQCAELHLISNIQEVVKFFTKKSCFSVIIQLASIAVFHLNSRTPLSSLCVKVLVSQVSGKTKLNFLIILEEFRIRALTRTFLLMIRSW